MKNNPGSEGLEGSGPRALEANTAALTEAQQEMAALDARVAKGEILDKEVRKVAERIQRLKEDRGKIESAGI